LVLCHGYGGSGALFYKIIKQLSERFTLIFFDLIGMGGSSRPKNFNEDKMTPEEVVDYFIEYIEAWRKAMNLDQFYLSAHSFGGFVCGHYALKYHMHIKKLLMLSPIGVKYDLEFETMTEAEKKNAWTKRFEGRKGPPGWARMLASWGWGKKISPFSFARFVGRKQTLKFSGWYGEKRQKVDNESQAEAVRDYMYQIFMRPGTTEFALMICFSLGLYSNVVPLGHETKLANKEFPIPISFVYGDEDWVRRVDSDYGKIVVEANQ